jgi:hypothetical protein
MDLLGLIGGLSLFLFGMTVMGQALERRAGGGLEIMLSKLTSAVAETSTLARSTRNLKFESGTAKEEIIKRKV